MIVEAVDRDVGSAEDTAKVEGTSFKDRITRRRGYDPTAELECRVEVGLSGDGVACWAEAFDHLGLDIAATLRDAQAYFILVGNK